MYRAFQRMTDLPSTGNTTAASTAKVHEGVFYNNDGLWDTFRCMHPLQLLVDAGRHQDILESYNAMYRQSGLMPSFPGVEGDLPVMIGFHAASLFADAQAKGIEADYETAYAGIRKNATEQSMMPWCCGAPAGEPERYWEKGFFPALKKGEMEDCPHAHAFERRQSVAVTLEHCYDDWCAGRLAESLGRKDDAAMFFPPRGGLPHALQSGNRLYGPEIDRRRVGGGFRPEVFPAAWAAGTTPRRTTRGRIHGPYCRTPRALRR